MQTRIPYAKPSITSLEVSLATDAAANGWGGQCYDYITRFEQDFKVRMGVAHAMATSSCTGALHLGLAALGIKPGDEVIMADINWVATASPIVHLGGTPVLVDILEDTWCLDSRAAAKAITPKTRAIIATHLYGNACDMAELLELGHQHGIPVIEDAAEAFGTYIGSKAAGSVGLFGVFSFHGTKTITTGEGGMLLTSDPHLFDNCVNLNRHGQCVGQEKQFWADVAGYKFRMANVQAAIGCAQLSRANELIARKREIFCAYAARLAGLPIRMNEEAPGSTSSYWMPTVVVRGDVPFQRGQLFERFSEAGIDARVFFWPLSLMPPFRQHVSNPVAYSIHQRAFNLPSYHDISDHEIDKVCGILSEFLGK